ncbi:MAG: cell division protein SepF [Actinomycetia bacterium]|nr:cell division protein SepF [Actinomycetes bacterium]
MPGVWKKTMNWLGLIDDDRYGYQPDRDDAGNPADASDDEDTGKTPLAEVTVLPVRREGKPERFARASGDARAVYPVVVSARDFHDAEHIGDTYRSGVPVFMRLTGVPTDQARRVLDFTAGMVYATRGKLEKVAPRVFLLTPADVEVGQDERDRVLANLKAA